MKKITKFCLVGFGLVIGAVALSSCTANFCSPKDTSKILYTLDRGTTKYFDTEEELQGFYKDRFIAKGGKAEEWVPLSSSEFEKNTLTLPAAKGSTEEPREITYYATISIDNSKILRDEVVPKLHQSNLFVPSIEYFKELDNWVLTTALEEASVLYPEEYKQITGFGTLSKPSEKNPQYYEANYDPTTIYGVLNKFGYRKFLEPTTEDNQNPVLFGSYNAFVEDLRTSKDPKKRAMAPGNDFVYIYQQALTQKSSLYRSCIYTVGDKDDKTEDLFGMYGDNELNGFYDQTDIERKDWGYAWGKGFLEGLLIYPISFILDSITTGIAGSNSALIHANGWAQVLAILIVTIIVRVLIMLTSLKTTLAQGKMQKIQPQLLKLQEKYPNANTNQYEKQKLAQEQMALYKKNKISPFGQIIVLLIQFPVFICVWGAMSGSSALGTGTFYNMNLSLTVWEVLTNTAGLPTNVNGWWTAFTLIILMSVFQVLATLTPLLIQRAQRKKVTKLGKNDAVTQQQKTMKIVQFVMLGMIIIMGFTLPSAMGIYWIAGALFSIAQTLIVYWINNRKPGHKPNKKIKADKVLETEPNVDGGKVILDAKPVEENNSSNENPSVKKKHPKNKPNHKASNKFKGGKK